MFKKGQARGRRKEGEMIPIKLVRLSDGKIFDIWKIIHGLEGEVSVWCNDWYGRHVIGQDCGFIQNNDCECNSEYKTG